MSERHTIQEWLAESPERRLELIDGQLIAKPLSGFPEGAAKGAIGVALRSYFHSGPGGWWLAASVDMQLGDNGFRPDLAGWRRERFAEPLTGWPVVERPDWICEVLSSDKDFLRKLRHFHRAGVPHFWVVDTQSGTLGVFRHEPLGYLNVLTGERGQRVRAEPFDAIELNVSDLLGDDPE